MRRGGEQQECVQLKVSMCMQNKVGKKKGKCNV